MKLKEYLVNDMISVKRDCSFYLEKFPRNIFYRGVKKHISVLKVMPRKDRKPVDMNPIVSKILDRDSKKIFGWPCRSQGTFVTKIIRQAKEYGDPYVFLPIGSSWKYIYAPDIRDSINLTYDMNIIAKYINSNARYSEIYAVYKNILSDHNIHDKDINNMMASFKYNMKFSTDKNLTDLKNKVSLKILDILSYRVLKNKYTDKNLNLVTIEEVIFNCQKEGYYLINPDIYQKWIENPYFLI